MSAFEALQWKKFQVLDDGFVCLVDVMGTDQSIVQAARVSYGRDERPEEEKKKSKVSDEGLIRYLMRHYHTTPFEMGQIKLLVRVPMDCWRQWIRHRTQSVNEYSTRYTEAIDSAQTTDPDKWRLQATSNKQGSEGYLNEWPEDVLKEKQRIHKEVYGSPGQQLTQEEHELHVISRRVYEGRLKFGVAKEQARKDLPLSTYTEAYVCNDLHNWFHFLRLRMDSHAQEEIRQYATTIGEQIVKPLFPMAWSAFEDYRLNSTSLSALDNKALDAIINAVDVPTTEVLALDIAKVNVKGWNLEECRERNEFITKMKRLGIVK